MKATGIVRRIDDLGRVVIPKEIRRTMRIREGDPLEIYTESDGEIVFKKYSPMEDLKFFATQYTDVLSKTSNTPTIICDREQVIAVSGMPKKDVLGQKISNELDDSMQERKIYIKDSKNEIFPIKNLNQPSLICAPIISSGDLSGSVIFMDNEESQADDSNIKLAQAAAMFLGKQMEN